MAITITGANGNVVSLSDATGRSEDPALQLQQDINNGISSGKAQAFDLDFDSGNPDVAVGITPVGIITQAGVYQIPSAYDYVVVADDTDSQTGSVVINNNGLSSNFIDLIAGRQSGITYNAGSESGQLINTVGNFNFNGAGKTGAWTIYTGDGNSTVAATDGNNRINTGAGRSNITLGVGVNSVYLQGQDTVTGSADYQSVTIGASGQNSDVNLGKGALILDTGHKNTLSIGEKSTITGGTDGTVNFSGEGNTYQGGTNSTITATGDNSYLKVIHGDGNTYVLDQKATFLNSFNKTSITINGQVEAFGARSSEYTVNAGGNDTGLFVADAGNETLNASGSTVGLSIYANTIVGGGGTNFQATGGSGNDTIVAGTGNSTFSGGAGDNYFMIDRDTALNGNTVITDFASSSQNKISLFNFNLDSNSLAQLLQNSQNDTQGDAVLNLDGHTLTVQGVSVSNLTVQQFDIGNSVKQTA